MALTERTHLGTLSLDIRLPTGLTMAVLTASAARANLYLRIDQASESHQPILMAGKKASAVLISAEDWVAIQETMHLLSIPGMRESIRQAMREPLEKSARELKW